MAAVRENRERSSGLSLAVRLQDGSTGAWAELVELYGPLVESWSAAAGLGPAAREDVAQEVFLAVHRNIGRFDPHGEGATFRGWLWRITRNVVLRSFRRRVAEGRGGSTALEALAAIPEPWSGASESDPPANPDDTTRLVQRALAQIRAHIEPQTWEAFWQTAILGIPAPQAARALGMTPAAVRKAKSRTLHRLRQQLGDER
jgi:RNA polymerase sigma-70 factor, ECF subfamily